MEITNNLKKFSTRGIILSVIILFSISLILTPLDGYGEEINVKTIGVDKTTIITLTNNGEIDLKTFRIWLSQDTNFQSFKTERGWVGEKTPQGVIIFTSSETVKTGESIKFGIKTDKINSIINWKGLNEKNEVIKTGLTKDRETIPLVTETPNNKISDGKIFSESTFKIIPNKPNSGSTIRVTGEHFEKSQSFDFYMNTEKLGSFLTDENGFFITTMKIPKNQSGERVDFKIKNNEGQEKTVSLRLGENENRIIEDEIKLMVNGFNDIVYRGEILNVSGTGMPGSAITVTIVNPEQITINTRTAEVDTLGKWKLSKTIMMPRNAEFGKYSTIISDGRNQLMKQWELKTDQNIIINPTKKIFDAGEIIKFNGTAIPNERIELVLEDDMGTEIISKIMTVDESGFIEFEYQTVKNDDSEGTWVLIATQEKNIEFTYVGYDEPPIIPINFKFNKNNYKSTEPVFMSFIGNPFDKLTMIIVNPSGGIQGKDTVIQLEGDGRGEYELDISGYSSGIYTAVIKKGGSQTDEKFSVGLLTGSGIIKVETTQTEYNQGERILLLGKTNPNSLMYATLVDPNDNEIKTVEIPSDNSGMFTENRLRIPTDGIIGKWKINIFSGSNITPLEFSVFSTQSDMMTLKVDEKIALGEILKIDIVASHKTSISIVIANEQGDIIDKTLTCNTTKEFICETFWPVPKEIIPGKYTVTATDAISSAESIFQILLK